MGVWYTKTMKKLLWHVIRIIVTMAVITRKVRRWFANMGANVLLNSVHRKTEKGESAWVVCVRERDGIRYDMSVRSRVGSEETVGNTHIALRDTEI